MTDLKGIITTICITIGTVAILAIIAYAAAQQGKQNTIRAEYEMAIELVKQCGDREWTSWQEHQPRKGRRITCYTRKAK